MTIDRDDDAYYRDVASRISKMTLEGKAPWLKDHAAAEAEVGYYPFIARQNLRRCERSPSYLAGSRAWLQGSALDPHGHGGIQQARTEVWREAGCLAFRNRFVEVTDTNPIDGTVASALSNSAKKMSYYYVYNAEQIRGMPPLQKDRDTSLVKKKTDNALKNTGARGVSDLLRSFSNQLPNHNCPAKETLAAITKSRLACQLRLPYKADVNQEGKYAKSKRRTTSPFYAPPTSHRTTPQ